MLILRVEKEKGNLATDVRQSKPNEMNRISLEEGSLGVPGCGTGILMGVSPSVMYASEWVMSRRAVGRGRRRCLFDVGAAVKMFCTQL